MAKTMVYPYTGDLAAVAALHAAAFPGFYLTEMGPRFLGGYYGSVRDYGGGILLGVDDAEGLAGFVAGFLDPPAYYRYYRSRKLRLLPSLLIGVARQPRLIQRSVYNIGRTWRRSRNARRQSSLDCELSSIAVAPRAAGQGLGQVLVEAFCEAATARGAAGVVLTTDRDDNEAVNRFYLRLGFVARAEVASAGRAMVEYYRALQKTNLG